MIKIESLLIKNNYNIHIKDYETYHNNPYYDQNSWKDCRRVGAERRS